MTGNCRKMIEKTVDSLILSKHSIQFSALFFLLSNFNHELFNHELWNYELFNHELFNHELFNPPVTFEHPLISPMILEPTGTRQARPGVADCSSITVGRQTVHTSPSTYILEAEAPFCSGEIENIFTNWFNVDVHVLLAAASSQSHFIKVTQWAIFVKKNSKFGMVLDPENALAQVQWVHKPVDLWDISLCTRGFWGSKYPQIQISKACPLMGLQYWRFLQLCWRLLLLRVLFHG